MTNNQPLWLLTACAAVFAVAGSTYILHESRQSVGGVAEHQARAGARKLYVVGVLSGVHVVDLATGKETKKIETGLIPHNLEVSADGRYVYVSNVGDQNVSVIDTATDTKVKDILVGTVPDIPEHRAFRDQVKLKNATSCSTCHAPEAMGTLPNALTWAPDGKHLLVNAVRDRSVSWLEPQSGKTVLTHKFTLPTPASPANMVVNPKTGEIWVLHRFEEYEKPGLVTPPLERQTGTMSDFAHDAPSGKRDSWVTVHDPEMKTETARLKMDMAVPFDGVFSPDGRWLYVGYRSTNQVVVFDAQTKTIAKLYETAEAPTGLAISEDGKELFVTCLFSRPPVVQVLDAATGEVKVSMGVHPSPSLVVQDRANERLYVTATGYNAVLEIDHKTQTLLRELPSGHQPLDLILVP